MSRHQLIRWHKAGLLPRPRRRGLGRGAGTESVYPLPAGDQLLALLNALQHDRRLTHAAWVLWCQGFPMTPVVRRWLVRGCSRWLRRFQEALTAFEEGRKSLIDVAETAPRAPLGTGPLRKQVGKRRFSTVIRLFSELLTGQSGWQRWLEPDDVTVLKRLLPSTSVEQLGWFREYASIPVLEQALAVTSDAQLETIRDEVLIAHRWVLEFLRRSPSLPMPVPLFVMWLLVRRPGSPLNEFIEEIRADKELWARAKQEFDALKRRKGWVNAPGGE